jgi:predicted nucleic acid-binding protein
VYLDSAYLVKYYVNEPDSVSVRAAIGRAEVRVSSIWVIPEMTCIFHRHVREGSLSITQARTLLDMFVTHIDEGIWRVVPVTDALLRRCSLMVSGLPAGVFLRAGDAVHLTTASALSEPEIWTNDRHLLAAAPYFGLIGRSA